MKNAFCFTLKALLVFLSWHFGYAEKRLDQKDQVNFKIYDVTTWEANSCNTHITQYLDDERQSDNEIWSDNEIIHRMW